MIKKLTKEKENRMNNVVVQVVKSGNRFNAWDNDGNKYTSQITTGARKRAYENGNALEQRVNKAGKNYWWAVPMSVFEASSAPVIDVSSVDVPEEHGEVLNFIHGSYKLKPKGLVMKELKWKSDYMLFFFLLDRKKRLMIFIFCDQPQVPIEQFWRPPSPHPGFSL